MHVPSAPACIDSAFLCTTAAGIANVVLGGAFYSHDAACEAPVRDAALALGCIELAFFVVRVLARGHHLLDDERACRTHAEVGTTQLRAAPSASNVRFLNVVVLRCASR